MKLLAVAGYYWHQNYKIFDIGLTARLWSRSAWFDQGAKGLALIINNSTADIFTEHIGETQSKDWVFCVAKCFKQITVQHLNVVFLVLVMAIYKGTLSTSLRNIIHQSELNIKRNYIPLGQTPKILKSIGVADLPMGINYLSYDCMAWMLFHHLNNMALFVVHS
jgi:hypothetical protein